MSTEETCRAAQYVPPPDSDAAPLQQQERHLSSGLQAEYWSTLCPRFPPCEIWPTDTAELSAARCDVFRDRGSLVHPAHADPCARSMACVSPIRDPHMTVAPIQQAHPISRRDRSHTLGPGSRIGPYEITEFIGAGGMGEVYRAHDVNLDRTVALKLLPLEVADDPDRVHRFEEEARAASALSHPSIVTIYDAGQIGSRAFISMELVAGETLREIMQPGVMPCHVHSRSPPIQRFDDSAIRFDE